MASKLVYTAAFSSESMDTSWQLVNVADWHLIRGLPVCRGVQWCLAHGLCEYAPSKSHEQIMRLIRAQISPRFAASGQPGSQTSANSSCISLLDSIWRRAISTLVVRII